MKVAQLTIEMAANIARLLKDMDAAKRSVDSAMMSIQRSADMAMKALGALGAGLSIAGLTAYLKTVIDLNDTLNDLNKSTGLSVQTLSGLNLAAKQSGSDLAGTAAAINKLQQNIGKNAEQYRMVGVTATNGLEAFKQLSDIFVQIEDPQLRAAFAAEALGKSWQSAAPLLSAGSQSIQDMIDRGTELSRTTPQIAAASDDFNDKLAEMSVAFTGAGNQLLEILLPRLTDLLEIFIDLIRESPLVEGGIKAIGVVFETVAVVGANVGFVIKTLWNELMMLGDIAVAIAKLDFKNVGTIWDESRAAAAGARAELDAWTASFMKGTTATQRYAQTGDGFNNVLKMLDGSFKKGIQSFIDYSDKGGKAVDVYAKMIEKADELVASLQFETKTLEMDNQERETAIQLRKLETIGIKEGTAEYEKYAQAIMDTVAVNESIKQRIKLEEEARKQREKDEEDAKKKRLKQEEDFAREVEAINNQIGQSLTDALMNGGMKAKDFLINMFKTLVLRPILQPIITGVTGALGFGTAGAALAGTEGAAGGMGSLSMASSLKSAYDFISTGFASVGESAAAFTSSLLGYAEATEAAAAAMTVGSSDAVAAALAQMESIASTAATVGAAATVLAGAAAGFAAGEFISGGKSVIGGSSMYATGGGVALGAAIGSIVPGIGTAIGAAVGGILGGVVNAAFGSGAKEYTDAGISGTLKAMGSDLQEYQRWKKAGGWFTSTKRGTEFNEINAELKQGIDGALMGISTSVAVMAASLGQPLDAINTFSQEIKLSFKDMSNEQIAQEIEKSLKFFETSLVDALIPGITQFARVGEKTAAEVLARMSSELATVNGLFDVLGYTLYEASLQGADAASKLVELFGGIQKFTTATNFFYENFYTQQEKVNYQTEQLTKIFGAMNLALPESNAGFRQLVEAAQAAGNDQLFATLVQLAPAFNTLQVALQQLGQTAEGTIQTLEKDYASAMAATNKAFDQLKESLGAELEAAIKKAEDNLSRTLALIDDEINATIITRDLAREAITGIKSVFDLLTNEINDLAGAINLTQTSDQARQFITQALETAQRTGYLPSSGELSTAVKQARGGMGQGQFLSAFEMRKNNLQLQNELILLRAISGDQLNKAELQYQNAEDQLMLLQQRRDQAQLFYENEVAMAQMHHDQQLQAAQNQIDALRGIDNSVISVAEAINNLAIALAAEKKAQTAFVAAGGGGGLSKEQQIENIYKDVLERSPDPDGLAYWVATGDSIDKIASDIELSAENRIQEISRFYEDILNRSPDAEGLAYWVNSADNLDKIAEIISQSPEAKGLSGFANGGYYPGGMAMVGERGPELIDFSNPGMVYSNERLRSAMGGGDVATEIRGLREENRIQSRAMVSMQSRMTRMIERWDGDGLPNERYEDATA